MKKFLITAITLGAIALQSCVTSLQPLVTQQNIITDNRITGNWTGEDGNYAIEPFAASKYAKEMKITGDAKTPLSGKEKQDSIFLTKAYVTSFTEGKVTYYLAIKLVKLNDQLFADVYPLAVDDKTQQDNKDLFSMNNDYLPGFTLAKVEINNGNTLSIKFIDGSFIAQQIEKGNMKLKHESNPFFGTNLITASSDELRQFISKYGNDERIYSKTIKLTRKPTNL